MKTELIWQYAHTWRVFTRVAQDFTPEAWVRPVGGLMPARLAFHILQVTYFYSQDTSTVVFESGKPFEASSWELPPDELPSQADILACAEGFQLKTERWLTEMDLDAPNEPFPWAGKTRGGVALFLLRHTLFHLGEFSALLNESKQGMVEDHYVKAL